MSVSVFLFLDLSYYKHLYSFNALKDRLNQGMEITHMKAGPKLTKQMVNH